MADRSGLLDNGRSLDMMAAKRNPRKNAEPITMKNQPQNVEVFKNLNWAETISAFWEMQPGAVSLASQRCKDVPAFGDSKVRSARQGWAAGVRRQKCVPSSKTQPRSTTAIGAQLGDAAGVRWQRGRWRSMVMDFACFQFWPQQWWWSRECVCFQF